MLLYLNITLQVTGGAALMLQIKGLLDVLRKSGNLRPYDWAICKLVLVDVVLVHFALGPLTVQLSNTKKQAPYCQKL